MTQTTNQAGVDLIKSFEGFKATAYKLTGEKYFTIGYGHSFDTSITASTVWSQATAEAHLKADLKSFESQVIACATKHGFKFNDNQFAALVSYCYNRGAGGLEELLSHSKTVAEVGKNMVVYWGSAVNFKDGLINRRKAETALFLKAVPAPPKPVKTVHQLALDVIAGKLGNGDARKKALGSQYDAVQKEVTRILG
jgi:GH24 family phage-related lysozyme (muramidase)